MKLLAVPNVSEGRDTDLIERLGDSFATQEVVLLDTHSDGTHNRSVFTLAGPASSIAAAVASGARVALEAIDMNDHEGAHPCIGAVDVAPVVWLGEEGIEPARTEALAAAQAIAELGVPVFLYGELASSPERSERAFFRRGGLQRLRERMASGLLPDSGPSEPHPTAGATLVTARAPIAAFNMALDTGDSDAARLISSQLRESGGGLPGVRAIGIEMRDGTVQVSTNVHDPLEVHLAEVVAKTRKLAEPHGLAVT
ncbi:glutamate formimidoyltransferase [soil metagenome]